jgi:hypothetical protein
MGAERDILTVYGNTININRYAAKIKQQISCKGRKGGLDLGMAETPWVTVLLHS